MPHLWSNRLTRKVRGISIYRASLNASWINRRHPVGKSSTWLSGRVTRMRIQRGRMRRSWRRNIMNWFKIMSFMFWLGSTSKSLIRNSQALSRPTRSLKRRTPSEPSNVLGGVFKITHRTITKMRRNRRSTMIILTLTLIREGSEQNNLTRKSQELTIMNGRQTWTTKILTLMCWKWCSNPNSIPWRRNSLKPQSNILIFKHIGFSITW